MNKVTMKLVLLGDGGVGKTSIRKQYLGQGFSKNYQQTMGADFAVKKSIVGDNDVNVQIWDIAGGQDFKNIRSIYYKKATLGLVVFDVTRKESLNNVKSWIQEYWDYNGLGKLPIIIVGNKADLRESTKDSIPVAEIQNQVESYKQDLGGFVVEYFETSAKTGENIQQLFDKAINQCLTLMVPK